MVEKKKQETSCQERASKEGIGSILSVTCGASALRCLARETPRRKASEQLRTRDEFETRPDVG